MLYLTVCLMTFLGTGYWAGKLYARFLNLSLTRHTRFYNVIVALSFWTMRFACWFSLVLVVGIGIVLYYLSQGYHFDPLVYFMLDRQSIWMVWLMIAMMIIDITFFKFEYVVPSDPALIMNIHNLLTFRRPSAAIQAILTIQIGSVAPQWKDNQLVRWFVFCILLITGALVSEFYIYMVGCYIGYNRFRFNHAKNLMGIR